MHARTGLILLPTLLLASASCVVVLDDVADTSSETETTAEGDGDGDPTTGDGDGEPATGDGDGEPATGDGDGDPTTGDGDGEPATGDGDGEPATGDGDGDTNACAGEPVLLYAQASNGASGGAAANGGGVYVRSADDFEVDDACWCVTEIVAPGEWAGAVLMGETEIAFYDNVDSLPGAQTFSASGVPSDDAGTLGFVFDRPAVLPAGVHWLSLMPGVPDAQSGGWVWDASDAAYGSPWAIETTIGNIPCVNMGWTDGDSCIEANAGHLAFELYGSAGDCP